MGFFSGRVTLCASSACGAAILEILRRENIACSRAFVCEGGEKLRLVLSERNAARLMAECDEADICICVVGRRGFPQLWERYGGRMGIWVGTLLAAVLVIACSRVVWDIRVTGNAVYSDAEIEAMLAESGLSVGSRLSAINVDAVENQLLLSHHEIGWVAINLKGTTANVEVVETVRGLGEGHKATNLVAARDGQIERIEAYDGNVCVKVGDVVREGELLVSGVYDGTGALRTTSAKGKIYARTVREFSVEIPLVSTQKVYTGREWNEKYVKFFTKRIKVFANTGNVGATCDIIYYNDMMDLFGGAVAPVGIETVKYREYCEQPITRSGQEAMQLAFETLESELESFVTQTGAELLKKTLTYELSEDAYRLRCEAVCIENIALTRELDID